ncbi:putative phosphatidylcholine-sterol O-acyltransferase [Cardiosporidium cionae]|uniref:Phosphatidylcholine-sterol O-acyltransferase n=1 Tax=Cardiosporidium cionae TaxID=476202 RepID=A0ABQ7J8L3_9APIC|nr:putative phosphatidylcholine-sterol O-acyltransferase [Cardiosporidium cionae]|eukprot:KAF8820317.1 putative phosphatidylcholine-sterol O-acyltransferase [Cardiosporidium cionae]
MRRCNLIILVLFYLQYFNCRVAFSFLTQVESNQTDPQSSPWLNFSSTEFHSDFPLAFTSKFLPYNITALAAAPGTLPAFRVEEVLFSLKDRQNLEKNGGISSQGLYSQRSTASSVQKKRIGEQNIYMLGTDGIQKASTLFIPGLGGSGLYASFTGSSLPSCSKLPVFQPTKRLWLPSQIMFAGKKKQRCWIQKLMLDYNSTTNLYKPLQGSSINAGTEGSTREMEYLDYVLNLGFPGTDYLFKLVDSFIDFKIQTYGFSYDWRYPPWQLDWKEAIRLIESVVRDSKEKVHLIAHSYGAVIINYFLTTVVDQEWKNEYINSFTSIGGAFGGTPFVVHALLSGFNPLENSQWEDLTKFEITGDLLLRLERSFGSLYVMQPNEEVFGADLPLVTIKSLSTIANEENSVNDKSNSSVYTSKNWTLLLPPVFRERAVLAGEMLGSKALKDPQVPVHCIWSRTAEAETEMSFEYTTHNISYDSRIKINRGEGDGTLPIKSASWCTTWASTVFSMEVANFSHGALLKSNELQNILLPLVSNRNLEAVD